jgi:tetrahydromethanopterin S-methyltransferase subunit A
MSGDTLRALYENGIDDNNRVIGAKGAVPYIENIPMEAVERFQEQVELIDLIDQEDVDVIHDRIQECIRNDPGPFGEPMIVVKIEAPAGGWGGVHLEDMLALHSSLAVDPYGELVSLLDESGDAEARDQVEKGSERRKA